MVKNVTAKGLIGYKVQTNRIADDSARSSQLTLSLYGFESKLVFSEIILCEKLSKLGLVLHDLQKKKIFSLANPHCIENPIYLFLFWEYLFQMFSSGSLQCSLDTSWLKVNQYKYVQSTE
jgi:hypothetical protein